MPFPSSGAIIADRLLGKYRTIFWLSLVYCLGHFVLSIAENSVQGMWLGLSLIAIGSGGIKPCVSANVGDQFGAGNWHLIGKIFQAFYFIINFGSFFATLAIPVIRAWEQEHFNWSIQLGGHEFTTSIAFGLPGLLMLIATIVFWMGRRVFVHVPPNPGGRLGLLDTCCSSMLFMGLIGLPMFFWDILEGQYFWPLAIGLILLGLVLFQWRQRIQQDDGFLAILFFSILAWFRGDNARARAAVADDVPADSIRRHWLFAAAAEKFDDVTAEGPLAVLKIISVFLLVSVFWSLFDQHASSWVRQATQMNLDVMWGSRKLMSLLPSQISAMNPLMVMALIPFNNFFLYPLIDRHLLRVTPLRKMTVGMFTACLAFVAVALLQRCDPIGRRPGRKGFRPVAVLSLFDHDSGGSDGLDHGFRIRLYSGAPADEIDDHGLLAAGHRLGKHVGGVCHQVARHALAEVLLGICRVDGSGGRRVRAAGRLLSLQRLHAVSIGMSVYVLATLDTKGHEAAFVQQQLRARGVEVTLVDTGCLGNPQVVADIDRATVFAAAGGRWEQFAAQGDRGVAVTAAARGAVQLVQQAHAAGKLRGVLGLGGSAGTTIATAAMRPLPLGVPKIMVSTLASGDVRAFVGVRDIMMINSVVDISGLNRISRTILGNAAAAMAGMLTGRPITDTADDRPLVAATMFGVTTPCVEQARGLLEQAGYEVLVFHATGSGGQAMEGLIRDGLIAGVLDITTTELADELVGGVMSAGPERLTAAAQRGVPQVVSVGATDMVNFWAPSTVPAPFHHRQLHMHNENVTLMRTNAEECRQIGQRLVHALRGAQGPFLVLLPQQGVSALDRAGQPFNDPAARQALFDAVRDGLPTDRVQLLDAHINDAEFARTAALSLIGLMQSVATKGK